MLGQVSKNGHSVREGATFPCIFGPVFGQFLGLHFEALCVYVSRLCVCICLAFFGNFRGPFSFIFGSDIRSFAGPGVCMCQGLSVCMYRGLVCGCW